MERRNAKPKRELVLPGDLLDDSGAKVGEYAYERDGKVYAAVLGIKNVSQTGVGVIPLHGQYMPVAGDLVIGTINDIGPSNWMVDINAPYPAPLHVNEVPWKVEFGDTSRFLNIGDVVLLKVLSVDESKKIQVTMNDAGLRKIEGGLIVEKEEWQADGSWIGVIEIPAGLITEMTNKLNSKTKGNAQVKALQ